jgi:hypothetical protein
MPQALNSRRRQQWDMCDQCGFLYPMSSLVKQKGALICTRRHCFDNLMVERRPWVMEEVIGPGAGAEWEGVDTRVVDRGFFEGFDETQQ